MKPKGRKIESKTVPKLLQSLTFQVQAACKGPGGGSGGPSPTNTPIHGVAFGGDFRSKNDQKSLFKMTLK